MCHIPRPTAECCRSHNSAATPIIDNVKMHSKHNKDIGRGCITLLLEALGVTYRKLMRPAIQMLEIGILSQYRLLHWLGIQQCMVTGDESCGSHDKNLQLLLGIALTFSLSISPDSKSVCSTPCMCFLLPTAG